MANEFNKQKQQFKNMIKYLDDFNYGIIKKDLSEIENETMNKLAQAGYFIESSLGYILSLKGQYELGLNQKQSDKVKQMKKDKVKIWSFSELEQWKGCALSYKLQRIDRVPQVHNSYALYGSLAHDIQEKYVLGEIEYKDMIREFKSRLTRLKELGATLPKDSKGGTTIQENYEKAIKDYFKHNYIDMKCQKNYKIEVEVFNEIDNNYIVGFIDLLKIKRKENGIFYCDIIDFKTSTMYSKTEIKERARQLLLYKYLLEKSFQNIKIENIGWDFMKYVKITYKDKVYIKQRKENYLEFFKDKLIDSFGEENKEVIEKSIRARTIPEEWQNIIKLDNCYVYYNYTQEDINEIVEFVKTTVDSVSKGISENNFPPRNYDTESFFCNNLCGFKKDCPHLKELGVGQTFTTSSDVVQEILKRTKERMASENK